MQKKGEELHLQLPLRASKKRPKKGGTASAAPPTYKLPLEVSVDAFSYKLRILRFIVMPVQLIEAEQHPPQ